MADTYEKDLAQKSSLTTSDFIRMVGSDNVSYKQGARSVAELMTTAFPYSTVTELLTWAESINGYSSVYTTTSTTDLPTAQAQKYGVAWTHSFYSSGSKWRNVFWMPNSRNEIWFNCKSGTEWSGWIKMPTRAEIDALTTVSSVTLTSTDSEVIPSSWTLRKVGNTCFLHLYNLTNLPAATIVQTGAVIPAGFRPVQASLYTVMRRASATYPVAIQVNTTGSIYFYNYDTTDMVTLQPFADTLVWSTL